MKVPQIEKTLSRKVGTIRFKFKTLLPFQTSGRITVTVNGTVKELLAYNLNNPTLRAKTSKSRDAR